MENEKFIYPDVLETKEDYEYIVKNFPKKYWEIDLLELFLSSDSCDPIATYKGDELKPENRVELTPQEKETFFKKFHSNIDFEVSSCNPDTGNEIRKYGRTWYEVKPCFAKDSKANRLGMDYNWVTSRLFLDDEQTKSYDKINTLIDGQVKELEDKISEFENKENGHE